MTSPISYVFECNMASLPLHLQSESSIVLCISVDEGRISIQLNSVSTDDAGVVSENLKEERVITLHLNASGDKYLRVIERDRDAGETEWPFDVSRYWVVNRFGLPQEAITLVNDAVCEWFGLKSKDSLLGRNSPWAFYPALRTLSIWKKIDSGDWHSERTVMTLMTRLSIVAGRTGSVVGALRGNADWNSFISDITKETKDASNTLALVSKRILEEPSLLEFAALDTGIPFSKLWREHKGAVQAYGDSFSSFDKHAIHLMLQFLPDNAKAEATQILLLMLKEWDKVRPRYKHKEAVSSFSDPFIRVSEKLKINLALELFESLKQSSSTLQDLLTEYHKTPTKSLPTNFLGTYNEWFYEAIFQPSIVSDTSSEDVQKMHKALFGVECLELDFYDTNQQTTFCHLKWEFNTVQDSQSPLIFSNIAPLIYAFPESKENSTPLNRYVDAEGYRDMMPSGTLYSPDDMVAILKLGAEAVDRALISLDRETTPDNRCAYLTMPAPLRDLLSTWRYYDLGVTEPGKINALKQADITGVNEILTYAQLPDEMFYEVIALLNH